VTTNLLSKDEIINTNQKTIDILVKKINEYVDNNNDIEKAKKDSVKTAEKLKLPSVYGAQKQTQINKNESINNGSKTQTSLLERHENAKQKIAFYQNNKEAQKAKIAIESRKMKGRG